MRMQEETNKDIQQDYFSRIVREKMVSYQSPVDDNCWDEIELALTSNRRKVSLWVWISTTVAASLALLLLLRVSFLETPIKDSVTAEQTDIIDEVNDQLQPKPISNTEENYHYEKEQRSNLLAKKEAALPVAKEQETPAQEIIEETPIPDELIEERVIVTEELRFTDNDWEEEPIKKKKDKWLLAASFSSGSGSKIPLESGYNSEMPNSDKTTSNESLESTPSIDEIFNPKEFSDVIHHAPLSFGINVRKNIGKHWAVESGLTYTYLLSKFNNQGDRGSEATIKMHYIGIPVNLVAYISNNNSQWNLYASVGGMVEKGILLDFTRTRYDGRTVFTTKLKEDIPDFQYSLNTSVGVSYNIYKDISLYFEPRITYYLNNNQPESIRTENPLIVGFSTGLRLGF